MEAFPKQGMTFEQARTRLMKYDSVKSNPNIANGLIEQAIAHEGQGAARHLAEEFIRTRVDPNNHSGRKLGSSPIYSRQYDKINWS